jgi:hypothetical protein
MGALIRALDLAMLAGQSVKQRKALVACLLENKGNPMFDGYMVVCPNGSLGLANLRAEIGYDSYYVHYGAAGPIRYWQAEHLRFASAAEIEEAGLAGVGCKAPPF